MPKTATRMSDKLARIHTHTSNRSKGQENAERKAVFKTVLDNPFRIDWPNVPLDVQRQILADLLPILGCVSEYLALCSSSKKKRTRSAKIPTKRKQGGTAEETVVATVAEPSTVSGIQQQHNQPPPILQHLTMGINEVTKKLERQIKDSRHKLTVSDNGTVTLSDAPPPIKIVFVCRGDIDPPLLVAHIPHLIAGCNSYAHDRGSSGKPPFVVKLVPLPKGAELALAEAIGFRRVAVLALDDETPGISTFDRFLESIPTVVASWLSPPSSSHRLVPTHIKQIRTSAPVDMRAAKRRRVEERNTTKQRKKSKTKEKK